MRSFNDLVAADGRVDAMILAIGDGLTVARRR
jgi:predicted O-methyltransferase YrrM